MVFSLDSSLVLAAAVGLWLVWVAPFFLGRTATAGTAPGIARARTGRFGAGRMMMTASGDDQAQPATAPEYLPSTPVGIREDDATAPRSTFSVRWGRLGIAAAGLLAVLATLVTLVLGLVGIVSLIVPVLCLAGAVAAIAVLRVLAVRDRRARVDRAFAEAMGPGPVLAPPVHALPTAPAAPLRPTALFDAEESTVRPLTAMELRTAALAVAHGSSAVDVGRTAPAETQEASGATAWAPVEVPRPTYVDAAKADRRAPAPLDLPEAPRPTTNMPIKASEAAARAATIETADTGTAESAQESAPATGRINLDDVLQRRRA